MVVNGGKGFPPTCPSCRFWDYSNLPRNVDRLQRSFLFARSIFKVVFSCWVLFFTKQDGHRNFMVAYRILEEFKKEVLSCYSSISWSTSSFEQIHLPQKSYGLKTFYLEDVGNGCDTGSFTTTLQGWTIPRVGHLTWVVKMMGLGKSTSIRNMSMSGVRLLTFQEGTWTPGRGVSHWKSPSGCVCWKLSCAKTLWYNDTYGIVFGLLFHPFFCQEIHHHPIGNQHIPPEGNEKSS